MKMLSTVTSSGQIITTVTGVAPLSVSSNIVVPNLNADKVDGYDVSNASGSIPLSNGTLNTNLNAEKLGGNTAAAFQTKTNAMSGTMSVYEQVAAYDNNTPSVTGIIKITLPKSWSSTMLSLTIKGYDFSTNSSYELILGGYNFSTAPSWMNCSASAVGKSPFSTVKFAHDGTKCCILLGTTSTVLSYPKIYIDQVIAAFSDQTGWDTGWAFSVLTSVTGITNGVDVSVTSGGGGGSLAMLKNTTTVSTNASTVNIGIGSFNKSTDVLFVYKNSTYIELTQDYTVSADGLTISPASGTFDGSVTPITFNFVVLKNVQTGVTAYDGSLIADGSLAATKLSTNVQTQITNIGTLAGTSGVAEKLNKSTFDSFNTTNTAALATKANNTTVLKNTNCDTLGTYGNYIIENGDLSPTANTNLGYPNEAGYINLTVLPTLANGGTNGVHYIAHIRNNGNTYFKYQINGGASPWRRMATQLDLDKVFSGDNASVTRGVTNPDAIVVSGDYLSPKMIVDGNDDWWLIRHIETNGANNYGHQIWSSLQNETLEYSRTKIAGTWSGFYLHVRQSSDKHLVLYNNRYATANQGMYEGGHLSLATGNGALPAIGFHRVGNHGKAIFMDTDNIMKIIDNNGTVSTIFTQETYGSRGAVANSFTISSSDINRVIYTWNADAISVTIPPSTTYDAPIGTQITFVKCGLGAVNFVPSSGVALFSKDSKRSIDGQYASVTLLKENANAWFLIGSLV